jgi:hypothetical protein
MGGAGGAGGSAAETTTTTGSGGGGGGASCTVASAVRFDGVDDRMTAPSMGDLLLDADEFAVGAFVTVDASASVAMTVIGRGGVSAGYALSLSKSGSDFVPHFQVMIDEGNSVTSLCEVDAPDPIVLGTRTHVLGTFSYDPVGSTEVGLFVDGQSVATTTCNDGKMLSVDPGTVRFVVGDGAAGPFRGDFDEIVYLDVPPFADFDPATLDVPCGPRDALWLLDCFDATGQLTPNVCDPALPLALGSFATVEPLDPQVLP